MIQEATRPVQQSQKFDLPSGAVLVVTVAPFADAWALMKASLKTLKGADITSADLQLGIEDIARTPSAAMLILNRVVDFATSPEVEAAVWKCAHRALYVPVNSDAAFPGTKVNPMLFDDPEYGNSAREDYARIVACVVEVNCKPFLVRALSGLLKPKVSDAGSPQQKSA